MNCNPTLTEQEFKVLHNTLWELGRIDNPQVQTLVEKIRREALKGAYEQDNQAFKTKHDYYSEYQRGHGLRSTWSIYELEPGGFDQVDPYRDSEYVVYDNHWGDEPVIVKIPGPTWGDLYRAADTAIRDSGDDHHCFIERFTAMEDKPGHLRLSTGS